MREIECKDVGLWDGGDRTPHAFYISKDVSDEELKKKYPHCDVYPALIVIYDSIEEREENTVQALRKSAAAKLTPLERKACGL